MAVVPVDDHRDHHVRAPPIAMCRLSFFLQQNPADDDDDEVVWVIGELTPHRYDDDAGGAAGRRLTTADDDGSVTIYKFWCVGVSDWAVVADPTEVQGWECESDRQRVSSNLSREDVSKSKKNVRYVRTRYDRVGSK